MHASDCLRSKAFFPAVFLVIFLLSGCAHRLENRYPFDFEKFQDSPIPKDVACWLTGGEQSRITVRIEGEAAKISGKTRRERLFKAMRHVWQYFSYDLMYQD